MVLLPPPVNFEWLVGLVGTLLSAPAVGGPPRRSRTLDLVLELVSACRTPEVVTDPFWRPPRRILSACFGGLLGGLDDGKPAAIGAYLCAFLQSLWASSLAFLGEEVVGCSSWGARKEQPLDVKGRTHKLFLFFFIFVEENKSKYCALNIWN